MSDLNVRKYFENMPYGKDAKASEIHGRANKKYIDNYVSSLVEKYDVLYGSGKKAEANVVFSMIRDIARQLDNLKALKEEFAVAYGGGVGGKNMFSNYTDLSWDRAFFSEMGGMIRIDEEYKLKCIVVLPNGEEVIKDIQDITQNWVIKGNEEMEFMKMQQKLVEEGQTAAKHPSFDIDFAVDNLLVNNDAWKIFVSDKIGGIYFLQEFVRENNQALLNGDIPDTMMHPDSFNPSSDNRLHTFYSERLRTSFDPNYQSIRQGNKSNSTVSGRTKISNEELPKLEDLKAEMQNQQ
tara:strand:+ start:652 stop:1533 length:882 start_codon:yes stop_codon:yes gene_type:complete